MRICSNCKYNLNELVDYFQMMNKDGTVSYLFCSWYCMEEQAKRVKEIILEFDECGKVKEIHGSA